MEYSANSEISNSTMRAGAKRAIWRHSSAPMDPPAPVTRTVLPSRKACRPASSSWTGSRPSRSSSSMARSDFPHALDAAENLDAEYLPAPFRRVIVDQAGYPPLGTCSQLLEESRRRRACAKHQDWSCLESGDDRSQPALLPCPVGEPAAAHGQRQQRRREHIRRAGYRRTNAQEGERGRNRKPRDPHRHGNPLQVRKTGVAPKPAVEPECRKHHGMDAQHPRQPAPHDRLVLGRNVEIEPEPERGHPRERHGEEIVHEDCQPASVHELSSAARTNRAHRISTHAAIDTSATAAPRKTAACTAPAWLLPNSAATAHAAITLYATKAVPRWPRPMRTIR